MRVSIRSIPSMCGRISAGRRPDVSLRRKAVDLGQVGVDAHETQVLVPDREPDRGVVEEGCELGRRTCEPLLRLPAIGDVDDHPSSDLRQAGLGIDRAERAATILHMDDFAVRRENAEIDRVRTDLSHGGADLLLHGRAVFRVDEFRLVVQGEGPLCGVKPERSGATRATSSSRPGGCRGCTSRGRRP